MRTSLLVASTLWATLSTNAFYLPGAAPHDYKLNEKVAVFVNALTPKLLYGDNDKLKSMINCLRSLTRIQMLKANCVLLDDYHNPKFQFCQPEGGAIKQPESLGSILFGDRIFSSQYDVRKLFSGVTSSATPCADQNVRRQ
ncbi:hypothetical protein C0993_001686 [Termitomyces sp. T159_Od127]|nr:hypothetical protein C0993_001686 [Termitomyces sp. T159_Od127]